MYMVPPFLAYYGITTGNQSMLQEAYNQVRLYSPTLPLASSGPNGKRIGKIVPQLPPRQVGRRTMAAHRPGYEWHRLRTLVDRCVAAYHTRTQGDQCG